MAYYIEKPGVPQNAGIGEIYYKGNGKWTDQFVDRKVYDNNPQNLIINPDGKNGGFTNAVVRGI